MGGISGNALCTQTANSANPDQCTSKGFYTADSWGYRLRAGLEYADLIGGVVLRPSVSFAHDVEGFGPTFNEGDKSVSIGLDAEYLSRYNLSVSYTDYFGGDFNTNTDRDFLAVSMGVSF